MGQLRELTLRPIGWVVTGRSQTGQAGLYQAERWEAGMAEIEIEATWAEALDGIEGFSHIWVLWWLDRHGEPPSSCFVHPEGREEIPLVGLFATRSPHRPCPLALTPVRLVDHRGARLYVQGLDAYEGTPVLDIKPYLRRGDLIPEATTPDWLERLWRIHDEEKGDA